MSDTPQHTCFAERRQRLFAALGDGVAILPTAPEVIRNRDAHHLYRFDSYFWYLTGFSEPEAVLVMVGGNTPQAILFCREKTKNAKSGMASATAQPLPPQPSVSMPPTRSANWKQNCPT